MFGIPAIDFHTMKISAQNRFTYLWALLLSTILLQPVQAEDAAIPFPKDTNPQKIDTTETDSQETEKSNQTPAQVTPFPTVPAPATSATVKPRPAPAVSKSRTEKPAPDGSAEALKLYTAGKYAAAAASYQKFIGKGTDNWETHMFLGACYQQLKKYDDALKQYDWVSKNAVLISSKQQGEKAAHTLRCHRAGICPANCLKLSMPGWTKLPGEDPNKIFMKFPFSGGYQAWSNHHLGELIVYENGKPVSKGKCPTCNGTGKVPKLK